jgi:AcrR family transcriptional regulator
MMQKRKRLTPEIRAKQIVDAAAAVLLNQGTLPLSPEKLREVTGVSKALIYAYFPTQHDLLNALLRREFEALTAAGMRKAVKKTPLREAAISCALIYFEHIADAGPLAHLILREHYMIGNVDEENRSARNRMILPLARAARRELLLAAKENIAAINLVITIPEEAGRLVHIGELDRDTARELCVRLVNSGISALAPTKR